MEAPRQRLWSRRAEQGSGGDPSDPGGEQDIDSLYARKSDCEAVLHHLQLRGGGSGPRWRCDRGFETIMSDGSGRSLASASNRLPRRAWPADRPSCDLARR